MGPSPSERTADLLLGSASTSAIESFISFEAPGFCLVSLASNRRVGETLVVGVKPRMCQLARFREQSFADFTELSTVPYCHLKTHSLRSDGSLPFALPLWMAASQMLRPADSQHSQVPFEVDTDRNSPAEPNTC